MYGGTVPLHVFVSSNQGINYFIGKWSNIVLQGKCTVVKALKINKSSNGSPRTKSQDIEEKEQVDKVFSQITNEQNKDLYERYSKIDHMTSNHRPSGTGGEFKSKVSKVRMLNSMALDWFRAHEQVKFCLIDLPAYITCIHSCVSKDSKQFQPWTIHLFIIYMHCAIIMVLLS